MGEAKAWKISKGNYAAISSRGKRYAGLSSLAEARKKVGLSGGGGKRKPTKKKSSPSKKKVTRTGKKGGFIAGMSGLGLVEDAAVGFGGGALFRLMGAGANAVPLARIVQGVAGYTFNRRGKKRLVYGVIDFVDNWLLSAIGLGVRPKGRTTAVSLFREARQLPKLLSY